MSYIYCRRNADGESIGSTAVCAEHFWRSPVTPQSVTSPMHVHPAGDGPHSCRFCASGGA